ncbi:MAG TPA: hypothetical protein V6C72_20175, partial [Chroococcales cyanobacterium]
MSTQLELNPPKPEKTSGDGGSGNWLVDNVVHPFVNGAVIQPYDALAGLTDTLTQHNVLPKCDLLEVPEAKTGSLGWISQTVSGGVGSLVPFIAAGKLTGGAMKGTGRFIEATPSLSFLEADGLTAKFLASDKAAMIVGAGLYGGAMDPAQGQTRLGNAIGSMVGFGAFEAGNSLSSGLSLSRSLPLRALTGAAGGLAQYETSNVIGNGSFGSLSGAEQSMLAGGTMNVLLPMAQRGAQHAIDSVNSAVGRPVSADAVMAKLGGGDNDIIAKLREQSPLTRFRMVDGETKIDQARNIVDINKADDPSKVAHELSHRITARSPETEAQYQQAAAELTTDPEAAYSTYRTLRASQELAARADESQALAAQGKEPLAAVNADQIGAMKASDGRTYDQIWQDEFKQFQNTDGHFRPAADYSSDYPNYEDIKGWTGSFKDEPPEPQTRQYSLLKNAQGAIHEWLYNDPEVKQSFDYVRYERTANNAFQRYVKTDGGVFEFYKVPVQTKYGTVRAYETFGDGSERYHIVTGDHGVADNSVYEVYPKGTWTQYGRVTGISRFEDGSAFYRKLGGTEAVRYATPEDWWFGKVSAQDTRADGSVVYHLADGNPDYGLAAGDRVEWYPNNLDTYVNVSGKGEQTPVQTVLRGSNRTIYIRPDNSSFYLSKSGTQLQLVDQVDDAPATTTNIKQFFEHYPNGLDSQYGTINNIEYRGDSTIFHKIPAPGQTVSGSTQVFDSPQTVDSRFGAVTRVDSMPTGEKFYYKTDGAIVEVYPNPIRSNFGATNAIERFGAEPWAKYYLNDGTTVDSFENGLSTNLGTINAVQRSPVGMIIYRTPPAGV